MNQVPYGALSPSTPLSNVSRTISSQLLNRNSNREVQG